MADVPVSIPLPAPRAMRAVAWASATLRPPAARTLGFLAGQGANQTDLKSAFADDGAALLDADRGSATPFCSASIETPSSLLNAQAMVDQITLSTTDATLERNRCFVVLA